VRRLIRLPEDVPLLVAWGVLAIIVGLFAWQAVISHT
jgi:hypothetical protein